MSYDLIVRGLRSVPLEQITELAQAAPWLEIDGDERGVLITNSNTGVYVTLSVVGTDVLYALNYQRPRFFAHEGILLLAQCIDRFAWDVVDLQRDVPVTKDPGALRALLDAWQAGNDAAPKMQRPAVRASRERSMQVWQWNYTVPERESALARSGVNAFVPKIAFVALSGNDLARTAIEWPADNGTIVLPQADFLVYRDRLDAPEMLDRVSLVEAASYFKRAHPSIPDVAILDAPRFSLLLSAIERSKRGAFRAAVVPPDMVSDY